MNSSNALPKVSVFLPTYNHGNFIAEAIDSILLQEYPNIEIVIGDDFSKDNTRDIILSYADQFPDIFKLIFHPQNIGVTANCNAVLEKCEGEFIALFSGDDVWLPGKLHAQMEWFNNNPDGVLCYTGTEIINEHGDFIREAQHPSSQLIKDNILKATYELGESGASFVIRKSAAPKRGFPKEIPIFSDWYFWNAVAFKGEIGEVEIKYARYRKHTNSTSTNNKHILDVEHLKCLLILKEDFPEKIELINKEIKNKVWSIMKDNNIDVITNYGAKQLLNKGFTQTLKKIFRFQR